MAIIGIDLGGTKISAALFSRDGKLIEKEYRLLGGATGSAVGVAIAEAIIALRARRPELSVEAVGICVRGAPSGRPTFRAGATIRSRTT